MNMQNELAACMWDNVKVHILALSWHIEYYRIYPCQEELLKPLTYCVEGQWFHVMKSTSYLSPRDITGCISPYWQGCMQYIFGYCNVLELELECILQSLCLHSEFHIISDHFMVLRVFLVRNTLVDNFMNLWFPIEGKKPHPFCILVSVKSSKLFGSSYNQRLQFYYAHCAMM